MNDLIQYARKVEGDMYEAAKDKVGLCCILLFICPILHLPVLSNYLFVVFKSNLNICFYESEVLRQHWTILYEINWSEQFSFRTKYKWT